MMLLTSAARATQTLLDTCALHSGPFRMAALNKQGSNNLTPQATAVVWHLVDLTIVCVADTLIEKNSLSDYWKHISGRMEPPLYTTHSRSCSFKSERFMLSVLEDRWQWVLKQSLWTQVAKLPLLHRLVLLYVCRDACFSVCTWQAARVRAFPDQ